MTALWWVLAAVALLLGAAFLWLAVLPIGLGVKGEIGPHHVNARLVSGSPFAELVRALRGKGDDDPANGIMVFLRAHLAGRDAGPYVICHELGHAVRALIFGKYRHTWRCATDPTFRKEDEAWVHEFALKHQSDGLIRILFERIAAAEERKSGTAVKVAG